MDNFNLALPILIPLMTAFLLPLVHHYFPRSHAILSIAAMLATLVILLSLSEQVFGGEMLVYWMSQWEPHNGEAIGISLSVDAWSLLVAFLGTIVGLASLVYSTVYLRHESGRLPYYVLVLLLLAGMNGFAFSGDLFNQFVWLEVFSVAAFALTGFHVDAKGAVEAAFKYLLTNSIASFFIATALALFYMQTGALNIAQIGRELDTTAASTWVAVGLMVAGYATKAALVPWHFWLPDAHTVAPAPVSAIFSGALIKIGIYAIARSLFTLIDFPQGSLLQSLMLMIASATMLFGGIQMLQQRSAKRILAYSSVSQMGYVALGLAVGTPLGLAAAAMHMLHHALVKGGFFMGVGIVLWRTGIHDLDEVNGLARKMPISAVLLSLAALSLSGMPFLSGYISKTLLEEAVIEASLTPFVLVIILSSIFTFAGTMCLLWRLFGGTFNQSITNAREAPFFALLPIGSLIVGSVIIGIFPTFFVQDIAVPASAALEHRGEYIAQVLNIELPESTEPETEAEHEIHIPKPADISHWGIPAIIALGGSLLAYLLLNPPDTQQRWTQPARLVARLTRRWHTGVVNDYALWNGIGTCVVVVVLLLATRLG